MHTCSLYHLSVYVTWLFYKDSRLFPTQFKQDLAGPAHWIASTSHPLHVTRLIAECWQGQLSLTADLYVGSDRALTAAAAVQMKELISLSDKLTEYFEQSEINMQA